jgi:hypothetical protein
MKGNIKCSIKKRFRVAEFTDKPPQRRLTRKSPIKGIADNKFVITVAPQNDIWPQGSTYPIKAVAIINRYKIIPEYHMVSILCVSYKL